MIYHDLWWRFFPQYVFEGEDVDSLQQCFDELNLHQPQTGITYEK